MFNLEEGKKRLNQAIDSAIENDYEIFEKTLMRNEDVYSHKNVVIFGTGQFFADCGDLEHVGHFEYVCDNDVSRWGKTFKGKKCLSPEELKTLEDVAVIIMVGEWRPIYRQLTEMGIACYPMDWLALRVYDQHYTPQWFERERPAILSAYELLADEQSKEVYVEAICNRIAPVYAKKIFNEIKIPGEYFGTDVFSVTEQEYLVDAGAYKGDSIKDFLEASHGKCGAIYSFELDPVIFKELEKTRNQYPNVNIELYQAGVGAHSENIDYSYTNDTDKQKSQICSLDEVLGDKTVSMIKMDVETYEIPALDGAATIIRTQKPKLAISAYHYLSDLWNVPLKILEIESSYRVYLRHHAPTVWDTDCYAYVRV